MICGPQEPPWLPSAWRFPKSSFPLHRDEEGTEGRGSTATGLALLEGKGEGGRRVTESNSLSLVLTN